jgi:hypothetical protein
MGLVSILDQLGFLVGGMELVINTFLVLSQKVITFLHAFDLILKGSGAAWHFKGSWLVGGSLINGVLIRLILPQALLKTFF